MRDRKFDCLIGPHKANIVRKFMPVFQKSRNLSRSPDLDGFLRLALRRARADGYSTQDVMRFVETGSLTQMGNSESRVTGTSYSR